MVGRGAVEADIVAVRLEVEGLEVDVLQVFRMKILLVDGGASGSTQSVVGIRHLQPYYAWHVLQVALPLHR